MAMTRRQRRSSLIAVSLGVLALALGLVLMPLAASVALLLVAVTALALFGCVLTLLQPVSGGVRPELKLFSILPGLAIAFRVEPLGMLFALIASGLWIVNSLYSVGYMRSNGEAHQTRFYVCFALALAITTVPGRRKIRCSRSTRIASA